MCGLDLTLHVKLLISTMHPEVDRRGTNQRNYFCALDACSTD